MRFSLGNLDVAEKVGIGYFFTFGDGVFGDKQYGIGPFNVFGGDTGFTSTLCQAEKLLAVEISQGAFSGLDRKVWGEDLAPVMVLITAAAMVTMGRG